MRLLLLALITFLSGCGSIEPNFETQPLPEFEESAWGSYSDYGRELITSIRREWLKCLHDLAAKRLGLPKDGTKIDITFRVYPDRPIRLEVVGVGGDSDKLGRYCGLEAIKRAAPPGEWSESMRRDLGEFVEVTAHFNYD